MLKALKNPRANGTVGVGNDGRKQCGRYIFLGRTSSLARSLARSRAAQSTLFTPAIFLFFLFPINFQSDRTCDSSSLKKRSKSVVWGSINPQDAPQKGPQAQGAQTGSKEKDPGEPGMIILRLKGRPAAQHGFRRFPARNPSDSGTDSIVFRRGFRHGFRRFPRGPGCLWQSCIHGLVITSIHPV